MRLAAQVIACFWNATMLGGLLIGLIDGKGNIMLDARAAPEAMSAAMVLIFVVGFGCSLFVILDSSLRRVA